MIRRTQILALAVMAGWGSGGCAAPQDDTSSTEESTEERTMAEVRLGPVDGRDLPPADTGRVGVGDVAPDFTLETYRGDLLTLSAYRGRKNVLLVFYRGHW